MEIAESLNNLKSYQAFIKARKNYAERHKDAINERARNKYNSNDEYKQRRLEQMKKYARKKREEEKALKIEPMSS
jgi:hypothetical protein